LERADVRPRQVRYQAALRPDIYCSLDSKPLPRIKILPGIPSDDTLIPLQDRTAIANDQKADLLLSIHANSSTYPPVAGTETAFSISPARRAHLSSPLRGTPA